MEKTLLKFVNGLSPDASTWEKKNHRKYGSLQSTCKQIEYDLRHGVILDDVLATITKIRKERYFQTLRRGDDEDDASMNRLFSLEKHFTAARPIMRW